MVPYLEPSSPRPFLLTLPSSRRTAPEKLEQRAKPKRRKQHSIDDGSQSAPTGTGRLSCEGVPRGVGGGGGDGGGLSSATLAQQLAAAAAAASATDCMGGQQSPASPSRHTAYLGSDCRILSGSAGSAVGFPSHSNLQQPQPTAQQPPMLRHVPSSVSSASPSIGAALQLGSEHHDSSAAATTSRKPSTSSSGGESSRTPSSVGFFARITPPVLPLLHASLPPSHSLLCVRAERAVYAPLRTVL
ncbi:unnamed protein product [Schistocephalus solidus]|uniref:Uncharacterized protein n=1 Tax=Schistocephalus solidus TaxID=70667 RepID=A0A183TAB3_SCHSO|nr:unnamed protein product [Schistocephalus solidus]